MAIKLEMDGTVFTFDTTEEYAAFTKLHNEVAEVEAAKEEPIKVGDMVEIIGNTDFYHDHEIGNVGEVIYLDDEDYLVNVDGHEQYVPKQDVKKVGATAKKEAQKETFYMIKSEYVDTDEVKTRDFKKGADKLLLGNKKDLTGLAALFTDYDFEADIVDELGDDDAIGRRVAFNDEHVYEVTREEFEAKKQAYLDGKESEKDAFNIGDNVKIIGNTGILHHFDIGSIGTVKDVDRIGDYLVEQGEDTQFMSPEDLALVTDEEEPAKESFKVGDIITGTDDNPYGLTNEYALMEVVESMASDGDDLRVRRLKHADGRTLDDSTVYNVASEHFVKTTEEEFDAKHGIEMKEEQGVGVPEGFVKVSFAAAKEGDYFLALVDGFDIEAGEMYVLGERCEGGLEFFDDEADERNLSWRDEDEDGIVIRKIVEETTQKDSFKVGDKVRVKASYYHNFPEGTIGTIEKQSFGSTKWVVKTDEKSLQGIECSLSGAGTQSIDEAHLEHAPLDAGLTVEGDVEVSNVNKIEAGDVVRITRKYTDFLGDSIKNNRLAVVLETRDSGAITVKQRSGKDYIVINAEDVEDTLELVAKAIK